MQTLSPLPTPWKATFGPFLLIPHERFLTRAGVPVRLGGRALDLLIALVEQAGIVVAKKDLLSRVWGTVVVDEGSLRFHMFAVRKALGDGEAGTRYIANIANKGYSFVAPVERSAVAQRVDSVDANTSSARPFPFPGTVVVGRDADVEAIIRNVRERRLVSIVGAGGIGKTTVVVASLQRLAQHFERNICFVDLSQVSQGALVRSTVAVALGLQSGLDDPDAIAAHLLERTTLLVLDCCEHVVADVAEAADHLLRNCPLLHVLATSREALRAGGEFVFRLPPLQFPPEGAGATAADAMAFPAVQLFVERIVESGSSFQLTDQDAPLASRLCRELDGIALAIELAAGRIDALGLKAVATHFDASVRLLWHGRRTAIPRHQTISATLDWSYKLLPESERKLLRRLSVFATTFTLESAMQVCAFDMEEPAAVDLLSGLVAKSLVNVDAGGAVLRYGMLDMTKSYCRSRLDQLDERAVVEEHFAAYFASWARSLPPDEPEALVAEIANLRAALDWYFGNADRVGDAVGLAALVCPALLKVSRLAECSRWAQAALAHLPRSIRDSSTEVQLQGALAQSLMFTGGDRTVASDAFVRSIDVAEALRDYRSSLHLLNGYAVYLHRGGHYTGALTAAKKAQTLLSHIDDEESTAIVDSLMGVTLHLVGDVEPAMAHFRRASAYGLSSRTDTASRLGFDHHIRALVGIARTLWLTGHYKEASVVAEEAIAKAASYGHAVTHCIALLWAGSVFTYAGDVDRLDWMVENLEAVARRHSLIPYLNVASVTRGQMLITRGRPAEGVERIRSAMAILHGCGYEMVTSVSLTFMARGLTDLSLHSAAINLCDDVERMIRTGGDWLRMPELLITRGRALAAAGQPEAARLQWQSAIDLARSQGVVSGQVSAAVALAQHLFAAGQRDEVRRILQPYLHAAGDETSPMLRIAKSLLEGS